jgi:uncharacterized protein YcnI
MTPIFHPKGPNPVKTRIALALAAAALACSATAQAHVSVVPRSAPAGSFSVFDVRVPNERDDAATVKVDLQLPPGFITASYQPVPGWSVRVIREQLDRPIETENGPISEQVSRLVWTGDGSAQGSIPPGAFQDFPLSVKLPEDPGATLTFKALQAYRGGEIVRWIGSPDSELPAAQITLTAATGEGEGAGAGHDGDEQAGETAEAPAEGSTSTVSSSTASEDGDDGASTGLVIAALVAGIAGVLLGGAALVTRRRT